MKQKFIKILQIIFWRQISQLAEERKVKWINNHLKNKTSILMREVENTINDFKEIKIKTGHGTLTASEKETLNSFKLLLNKRLMKL